MILYVFKAKLRCVIQAPFLSLKNFHSNIDSIIPLTPTKFYYSGSYLTTIACTISVPDTIRITF